MQEYGYVVAGWVLGTATAVLWLAYRSQAAVTLGDVFIWLWCGVTKANYRKVCLRCGVTGQAHMTGDGCWRYR